MFVRRNVAQQKPPLIEAAARQCRVRLFMATILLISAGGVASPYALATGMYAHLALYAAFLWLSVYLIRAKWTAHQTAESKQTHEIKSDHQRRSRDTDSDVGLAAHSGATTGQRLTRPTRPPAMIQQNLDLDGTEALRSLSHVTGQWLVTDASEPAALIVRRACMEISEGGEVELDRIIRWFDIADSLRSRECRALPKAELRRCYVAEHHGVSKEQVRQIDQGRYLPLNKLLNTLDPKSL